MGLNIKHIPLILIANKNFRTIRLKKMNIKIKRALISVSNKAGILDFARNLSDMGVELLSTGGTAKANT